MREFTVVLSSKGQFTLPAEVRRELALDQGARLRLVLRDDGTVEVSKPRFSRVADIAGIGQATAPVGSPREIRDTARVDRWQDKQRRSE